MLVGKKFLDFNSSLNFSTPLITVYTVVAPLIIDRVALAPSREIMHFVASVRLSVSILIFGIGVDLDYRSRS